MLTRNLFMFLLCAAPLLACDDDPAHVRFPIESGLPADRKLATLSSAEADQLCSAVVEGARAFGDSDATKTFACTFAGAVASISLGGNAAVTVDTARCERLRDECLALPAEGETTAACQSGPPSAAIDPTCQVSVREYESCLERYFDATARDWEATTCESIVDVVLHDSPGTSVVSPVDLPGCEHLVRDCPTVRWPSADEALDGARMP